MIGYSKKNRENCPRKCFWWKEKDWPRLKFNPGLALISLQTTAPRNWEMLLSRMMQVHLHWAGKLKSGQECAHKFNEKCFGVLTTVKTKILEILTKMQPPEDKRKRMYPTAKEGLHPIREGKNKIKSNQKSGKLSVKRKIVKEFFH